MNNNRDILIFLKKKQEQKHSLFFYKFNFMYCYYITLLFYSDYVILIQVVKCFL
jgi:hypothetical protein